MFQHIPIGLDGSHRLGQRDAGERRATGDPARQHADTAASIIRYTYD